MRILFFASNGLGIGHLTRLLSVAEAVTRLNNRHEILFLTNSEAAPFPEDFPFYAIRIPGRNKARSGGLTAKSYLQTVRPIILQAIASFDPHILVTDTFPEGPERELIPVMEWPILKTFIFREQILERVQEPVFRDALRPYHRILIPHDRGTVPLPKIFSEDPRLRWTGPIVSPQPHFSRAEARKRLGIQRDSPLFLLSFGGGGDPLAHQRARDAAQYMRQRGFSFFHASGPLSRTLPTGIHASEWLPLWPIKPYLPAFDGVIASGGYNTVHELLELRIPALLLSFPRALDPQSRRVEQFVSEKRGLSVSAEQGEEFQKTLETFLTTCQNSPGPPDQRSLFSGATCAAQELLDLDQGRAPALQE